MDSIRGMVLSQTEAVWAALKSNGSTWTDDVEVSSPILKSIHLLRDRSLRPSDFSRLSEKDVFSPFLDLIESETINANITAIAISSLSKFIVVPWIDVRAARSVDLVRGIISSLSDCKFESSDFSSDDTVFMKILMMVRGMIMSDLGRIVPFLEAIQLCYRIGRHQRATDFLRRTAEHTLNEMVMHIFERCLVSNAWEDHLLPQLERVYEFLVSITVQREEPQVKTLGYGLIIAMFETCGEKLVRLPGAVRLTQDRLFLSLMQTIQSHTQLAMCLRLFKLLYISLRDHLRPQIECFVMDSLMRRYTTHQYSDEMKAMVIDTMQSLVSLPRSVEFLYASYDCQNGHLNVLDEIGKFLSKHCFPSEGILTQLNVSCLKCMERLLQSVVEESMELGAVEGDDARIEAALVRKREAWSAIDTFNHSPSKGVASMIEKGIISSKEMEPRAQELATSLRDFAVVVSQDSLGDFFGGKDEFNLLVLEKYIDSFDFKGMALDDALRFFLSHFRLPGEGQMIDRIVQRFSAKFFEDNRGYHPPTTDAKKLSEWFEFQSSDAAYVLTFSIIMLNTDLHNPMVKRKMSVDDFVRNNARVTDSDQLPEAFLAKIYERTAQHELRVAPPIIDAHRYSYRWQEIVELSWKSSSLMSLTSLKHAFLSLWGPAMAAFSVTFDNSNAMSLIGHASNGFMAAATAASHYRISEVVDKLIVALTKFTQVLSPISVHSSIQTFGKSRAAMQAARTVFDITKSHGDMIREGWREVLDLVLRMYNCGLMPVDLRLAPPKNPPSSKPTFSLFNYFSSYSEEHLDAEENARKCVHECGIRELMSSDSKFLEAESLVFLIKALIFAATDALQNHDDANSAVVCLELLVRTVLSNRDRVLVVYDVVHEFFYRLFHFGCTHIGPANFVLEKTIQGILKVCTRLLPRDDLRDRLFKTFGILKDIPIVDLKVVGEGIYVKLVEGIHVLVDESGSLIREPLFWKVLLSMLIRVGQHCVKARRSTLETFKLIVEDHLAVYPQNMADIVDGISTLAHTSNVEETLILTDMLISVHLHVSKGGNLNRVADVENPYVLNWLKALSLLAEFCGSKNHDLQQMAVVSLQRTVLAHELSELSPTVWIGMFDNVLFPLLSWTRSADAELRLRSFGLVSKGFLRIMCEVFERDVKAFNRIWCEFLVHTVSTLEGKPLPTQFRHFSTGLPQSGNITGSRRNIGSDTEEDDDDEDEEEEEDVYEDYTDEASIAAGRELLAEALPEIVKNMLLVMKTQGCFTDEMRISTEKLLSGCLVHVLEELQSFDRPPSPREPKEIESSTDGRDDEGKDSKDETEVTEDQVENCVKEDSRKEDKEEAEEQEKSDRTEAPPTHEHD